MIGGEYKKERFSERLTQAQNQPQNRGYLPGTQLMTGGYTTGTLLGNWSEERADAGYYDGQAVVRKQGREWTSTYAEMTSHTSSSAQLADVSNPCDRTNFDQETFIEVEDRTKSSYPAHQPHMDPHYASTVQGTHLSTFTASFKPPEETRNLARAEVRPVLGGTASAQANGVLQRLRRQLELSMPGSSAFPGNVLRSVRRCLAAASPSSNGKLNARELQEGLVMAGIDAVPDECTALIRHFDQDGSKTVTPTCIADALRGAVSSRRSELMESVLALLKSVCENGVMRLNRMVELIDVSQLDAVKNATYTVAEARDAFATQWDARHADSFIDEKAFYSFFSDASFEVANDNDFELMMRNVWHLSGGRGTCANTSCRRVKVVHTNGRTTNEEIKNDLTIRGSEEEVQEMMRANLYRQGIKDVKKMSLV